MENQTQAIKLYQQRNFSEKLNATFNFIGQNAKSFFKAQFVIAGPVVILIAVISTFLMNYVFSAFDSMANDPNYMFSADYFITTFSNSILSALLTVVVFLVSFSYLKLYHQKDGGAITPSEVFSELSHHFWKAVLLAIVVSIVVMFGTIFFVIPGVYLIVVFALVPPVLVNEDAGFGEAFSKPFSLISGKWWSTFGLLILTGIIGAIIYYLIILPVGFYMGFETYFSLQSGDFAVSEVFSPWVMALSSLLGNIGTIAMYSIINIAIAFQYYNLVEMKESKGLLSEIDELGKENDDSANEGQY